MNIVMIYFNIQFIKYTALMIYLFTKKLEVVRKNHPVMALRREDRKIRIMITCPSHPIVGHLVIISLLTVYSISFRTTIKD